MLSLLKVEWMKVKNYRTFWILLIITIVSIPGISYMFYNILDNSFSKGKDGQSFLIGSPFAFPEVWQTVAWNAGMVFIIPALLIITLTTNEFTFRTHRQNIIDGWSRQQFITIKLLEILLLSLFCTLVVVLTALGFGLIGNKLGQVSLMQHSRFVFFYFMEALSYSLIAFLIAMLIKRAGLSIGVFFIYMLIEQIIVGFGRGKFKYQGVNYLPEEVTDRLIPVPYAKALLAKDPTWEHLIPSLLIVAVLYICVYCFITARRFLKSDL